MPSTRILRCAAACLAMLAATGGARAEQARYVEVHDFAYEEGTTAQTAMTLGADGALYGTMLGGGIDPNDDGIGLGTVFRVATDGAVTVLHVFQGPEGSKPNGRLVQAADGRFWGTTSRDGALGGGTVFTIDAAGRFELVRSFDPALEGIPTGGLTPGDDGTFYGALNGPDSWGRLMRFDPRSGAVTILHSFPLDGSEGALPMGELVKARDGAFWGITQAGGYPGYFKQGNGTIFKMTPDGEFTVVHRLLGHEGCDAAAGLTAGRDGRLYGTAQSCGGHYLHGSVFSIELDGTFTHLYAFPGECRNPQGALAQGRNGTLYGVAFGKLADIACAWSLAPDGRWQRIRKFGEHDRVHSVQGGLVIAGDALFGIGANFGMFGDVMLYRLRPPAAP